MNIFSPHISLTALTDLAESQATPPARVLEHLDACSECANELRELRQAIGMMRADNTEDAPADLVEYAKNTFRGSDIAGKPSRLARILASLSFDSLTAQPVFGVRSSASAGRQLLYSTEIADIDLRLSQQSGAWEIEGQVLGSSHASGQVSLKGDSFSAAADLNELAEFSLQAIPGGTYKMFVRLPEVEIEIPPLQLG